MKVNTMKHEVDEVFSWLTPLVYGSKHSDILQRHEEGTGKWLIDSEEFMNRQTCSGQILWCQRKPGTGKTTLSSFIISEYERTLPPQPESGLVYAYCNYNNVNETATNIVGSLLQQLLRQKDILPPALKGNLR
ncbi:hypothetical protein EJ08DRAFT_99054 [Tothia fuscella]|uniref:Nephrocystin 3-like N-terminal domain-containing protein n=1 Tax=Tothia fuscella TaxID=1048955 RepID=A0A9P4NEB7_9PEZI|nr:hypothetical protein EJ08DRAFT_99054 [Tothia fuscella]